MQVKLGSGVRNTGGIQSITGIGFRPILIQFTVVDSANTMTYSTGACGGGIQTSQYIAENGSKCYLVDTVISRIKLSPLNHLNAVCDTIDDDGFTITWTLVGTVSVDYSYICMR